MAAFYPLFYGHRVIANGSRVPAHEHAGAVLVRQLGNVDRRPRASRSGETRIGSFDKPRPARDQSYSPCRRFRRRTSAIAPNGRPQNAKRLQLAAEFLAENDELLGLLHDNLARADCNRTIWKFFSPSRIFTGRIWRCWQAVGAHGELLRSAADAAGKNQAKQAVASLDQVLRQAKLIR